MGKFCAAQYRGYLPRMHTRFKGINGICALIVAAASPAVAQQAVPRLLDGYRAFYGAEMSYTGESSLVQGHTRLGDLSTWQYRVGYLGTLPSGEAWQWRLGFDWQRFDFNAPESSAVPDTMQVTALKIGASWKVADRWSLLAEADPGFYSDFEDLSGRDINAPAGIRATFSPNPNLDWVFGVQINTWNNFPVLPAVGARWRFHEDWNLSLLFPRPKLEYSATERLVLSVGGEFKGTVVRVSEDFGAQHGDPKLDNDTARYREIRAGVGIKYMALKNVYASLEGGWAFNRRHNFDDADLQLKSDDAPYVQFSISGSF
jgi:hypothetical protein